MMMMMAIKRPKHVVKYKKVKRKSIYLFSLYRKCVEEPIRNGAD